MEKTRAPPPPPRPARSASTKSTGSTSGTLSASETQKQLEALLQTHENLYQQTPIIWKKVLQHGIGSGKKMAQHVKQLCSSYWAYEKQEYNFAVGREYQALAAEKFVQSQSIPILCGIVVIGLQGQDNDYFKSAFDAVITFACGNPKVCKAIKNHGKLLPAVVVKLDKLWYQGRDGKVQVKNEDVAETCLGCLNNVARTDGSVHYVRDIPRVFDVVRKFLNINDASVKIRAIKVLAAIATDEQAKTMNTTSDTIQFVLKYLKEAEDNGNHYVLIGRTRQYVSTFARDVKYLARNDTSSRQLVKQGVLPLIATGLLSEDKDEEKDCIEALWWLSFNKENKADIAKNDSLLDLVYRINLTGTGSSQRAADGVLFQLRDHLIHSTNQAHRSFGTLLLPKQKSVDQLQSNKTQNKTQDTATGHVMLSYQTASRPVVKMVCDYLQENNIKVWMDIYNMAEGESSTAQTMAEAVEESAVFLMCTSESYKDSQYCRSEAEYAYERQRHIIPLKVQRDYSPDGWLGFIQGSKFFYDFTKEERYQEKLTLLLSAVRKAFGTKSEQKTEGAKQPANEKPKQTEGSHGEMPLTSPVSGVPASSLGKIRKWTRQDVEKWRVKFDLQGEKIEKFTGMEIAYLVKMQSQAPETFHQLLMNYVDLSFAAKLDFALEGVLSM